MKLWDYDPETLLPNLPQMFTFPKLHDFYADWEKDLRSKGVDIKLETDVTSVRSRNKDGVVLTHAPFDQNLGKTDPKGGERPGGHVGPTETTQTYDQLILCVLADDALAILGKAATWKEKFVLRGAHFYDDISITHSDSDYFAKNFETFFDDKIAAEPKSDAQKQQLAFSKNEIEARDDGEPAGYRPMYCTHSYKEDMTKIEMAFDCTNYQHQFRDDGPQVGSGRKPKQPFDQHVFQSIFLDKTQSHMWTWNDIDTDKIILRKWWHQLGHRWQHYVRVVPGMMWIQGKNRTLFAGSWNLVNMHEMACVSGIACAWRCGAEYEVFDDFAEDLFQKYCLINFGKYYKKKGTKKDQ